MPLSSRLRPLGFAACACGCLWGQGPAPRFFTEPVPQEVWAMRGDPALAGVGAVVLEDRWRLGLEGHFSERIVRVRILDGAGRKTAGIEKMVGAIEALEGRISYPDGSSVVLDRAEDLHEKTLVRGQGPYGEVQVRRAILEPPGITQDCLYELRLKVRPGPPESMEALNLQNRFPTRVLVVEMHGGWNLNFLFRPNQEFKPQVVNDGKVITTTFRDLPALEEAPFSVPSDSMGNFLYIYPPQTGVTSRPPEDIGGFWRDVATELWKRELDLYPLNRVGANSRGGRISETSEPKEVKAFRALEAELAKDLPGTAQAKALELHARLSRRITQWPLASQGFRTWALTLPKPLEAFASWDLEAMVRNGAASSGGWFYLYYTLLKDAGVHPDLVEAVSARHRPLLLNLRSTDQFDHALFRIREEGKAPLFLDPAASAGHAASIPGAVQGTEAVVVDTTTWVPTVIRLPWQAPASESTTFTCQLDPEGTLLRFRIAAAFQGAAEPVARRAFQDEAGPVRGDHVAMLLEGTSPDLAVEGTQVGDPSDLAIPFTWTAQGHTALPGGDPLRLTPFPGRIEPFPCAEPMPETRLQPIYLGPPRTFTWHSSVALPAGFHWVPEAPTTAEFSFAAVRRTANLAPAGGRVEVTLQVATTAGKLPAGSYAEFRQFLAALRAAARQPLLLERVP